MPTKALSMDFFLLNYKRNSWNIIIKNNVLFKYVKKNRLYLESYNFC